MKKYVLTALLFIGFIGLVFGLTFISDFMGEAEKIKPGEVGADGKRPIGAPFVFLSSQCKFDPASADLQNRMFRGFYEVGETDSALFWFKNRSPREITITSLGASCTTCSRADIAAVTPDALAAYARGTAAAGAVTALLPGGLPDLLSVGIGLAFDASLPWKNIPLDILNATLTLPPTGTFEKPGWGLVRLQLKASQGGSREPKVAFQAGVDDEVPTKYELQLSFQVVGGFAVRPVTLDVGELPEGVPPKPFDLLVWSATRHFGERTPPPVVRPGDDDPYVRVGPVHFFTPEEIEKHNTQLSVEAKSPSRVLSAYRYPVTVLREANGKVADLGPFTKPLYVAGEDGERASVTIVGTVVGAIRLAEGKEINFGTYEAQYPKSLKSRMVSDRTDLDLEIVPGETRPRFLKATLDPPTVEGGQKAWRMNLSIEANQGFIANWTGSVVLRTTGPNPITVRVPVKGSGSRR